MAGEKQIGSSKTVKAADGEDVTVTATESDDGSLHIVADCVGFQYGHSFIIGGADRPLAAEYDAAAAQTDFDKACQFAADMAASKKRREDLKSQLK